MLQTGDPDGRFVGTWSRLAIVGRPKPTPVPMPDRDQHPSQPKSWQTDPSATGVSERRQEARA